MRRPIRNALRLLAFVGTLPWAGATAHGPLDAQLENLERRIGAGPDLAPLYVERAALHQEQGDRAAALLDLQRAAALDPALPEVHRLRGLVLLEERAFASAAASLGRYLAAVPEDAFARAARARAWFAMDRPLEAAAEYTRVIAERPTPLPEDYLARARALANAPEAQLDQAIRGLDEGQAALGPVVSLGLYAVELEQARGRPDAALERLALLAADWPRQDGYWMRRGEILERAGQRLEARAAFRRALEEFRALPAERRQTPAGARQEARVSEALLRLATPAVGTAGRGAE